MQPDLFGAPGPAPKSDRNAELHRQLVKLGDMLGDGLGDEPDGKWIAQEYRQVCKALGYTVPKKPRRNNTAAIDAAVATYLPTVSCECGAQLAQTRSGARRAVCVSCGKKYRLSSKPPQRKA